MVREIHPYIVWPFVDHDDVNAPQLTELERRAIVADAKID